MPRYDQDNLPAHGWGEFRKLTVTKAVQMNHDFEVVTIDGNTAKGKAGDYLCVDSQGHPYPCNKYEFACIYAPIEEKAA